MKMCNFEDCENNTAVRGYCRGHYAQLSKGQELKPLRKYKKNIEETGRVCTKCGAFKVWEMFYKHVNGINGRSPRCMACEKVDAVGRYHRKG